MKLFPALIVVFAVSSFASKVAAQELFGSGARFQALAGASGAITGNWSVFGNQAGLAVEKRFSIAGSFQNRFLVKELSAKTGLVVLPAQSNVFALFYSQFGQIPFRQEKIGFAYARCLGTNLRIGLQFNRYGLYLAEENHSENTYGVELGVQYELNSKLTAGLHVINPYQTWIRLSAETYRYDSKIRIGTFYRVSDDFGWAVEIENCFDDRVLVKSGFEYEILDILFIRAGVAAKPYRLSGGFGLKLKKIMLDLATSYDHYLGNSPSVSFQYQF